MFPHRSRSKVLGFVCVYGKVDPLTRKRVQHLVHARKRLGMGLGICRVYSSISGFDLIHGFLVAHIGRQHSGYNLFEVPSNERAEGAQGMLRKPACAERPIKTKPHVRQGIEKRTVEIEYNELNHDV